MVVGATLVAAGCSASSHRRAAAPTTTSVGATTTTTEPPPQYASSPYSWDRASSAALQVGGGPSATLSAVLAPQLSGPWMVFGSRLGPSGSPSATVWSSADALTWTGGALDPAAGASQATAAARYRNTTVVVGSTGEGAGQQVAVWVSTGPGSPFSAQAVPASNGPSVMTHVAAGALGMFATGTVDGRFAMWSSTNGRQWSELPGAEKAIGAAAGARINVLAADGDYMYAAGSIQPGSDQQAALWVTGDGINWHLVGSAANSFSGPEAMVIYSLATLGNGLVAVGAIDGVDGWEPASWISPDGQSWSLPSVDFPSVPHPAAAAAYLGPGGGTAARSVSAIPTLSGANALVATGGGPYGQQAWQSADGLHWTSLSLPAGLAAATSWRAEVTAATADRAVVLDSEPGQPYLLTDRAALLSGIGGSGPTRSSIAGTWSQPSADPAVFGPVRPEAVPVSLERVLTGNLQLTVDLVRRPQAIGAATVTTLVLSSADGSTWAAVPGAPVVPGAPPAAGAFTARLPSGWVAVASTAGTPAETWTSANGSSWVKTSQLSAPPQSSGISSTSGSTGVAGASLAPSVTVNGVCTARIVSSASSNGSVTSTSSSPTGTASRYLFESVGAVTSVTTGPSTPAGGSPRVTVTRVAGAWYSPTGATWRNASVNAAPPAGGTASMSGCQPAGSGLVAFGAATANNGAPQPALWRSTDGAAWTRTPVSAFGSGMPEPLLSLATDGDYWLAAANPDPSADPIQAGVAASRGPAATAALDAGVGPSPSVEDGREAVWLSLNGGSAWQLVDTATAPWLGNQRSSVDLVAFTGSGSAVHATSPTTPSSSTSSPTHGRTGVATGSGTRNGAFPTGSASVPTPVVAGVVDGQLVVWIGTPVSQAPAG